MNAIILAAGEGKRLRPLTNNIPKCMVKIFNKSIIEYQISTLRNCGIFDISIVTGYQKEKIDFEDINYFENPNYDSTNMVETLFCAEEKLLDETIISYGDIIYEKTILQKLIKSNFNSSIIVDLGWESYWKLRFNNILDDAESLLLDDQNHILEIGQKTSNVKNIQGQYIGLMKFNSHGIKLLKNFYHEMKNLSNIDYNPLNQNVSFQNSYMTDLLQSMINSGIDLNAIPVEHGWIEVDTMNDFELYVKLQNQGKLEKFFSINQ